MGWGPLFFGYFLEFLLGSNETVGAFIHLIGRGMMLVGVAALQRYLKKFEWVRYALYAYLLVALPLTAYGVGRVLGFDIPFLTETVMTVLRWCDLTVMLVFHLLLALAIKDLALRVDLKKNAERALMNFVPVAMYTVCYALCLLYPEGKFVGLMLGASLLLRLFFVIANCVLLYSCYMRIAPAGGEDMKRPPSRFAFINRMREAFDKKEQQAIEADRAWHADNAKKRRDNRSRRQMEKDARRERNQQTKK